MRLAHALGVALATVLFAPAWVSAQTIYYIRADDASSVGADGTCNLPSGNASTEDGLQWKTTFTTTAPSGTSTQMRTLPGEDVETDWFSMGRVYRSANYASATEIAANPTGVAWLRSNSTSDQYQFLLKDYDPAGAAGNGILIAQTAAVNSPSTSTATQVNLGFTGAPYTIPAGHRLLLEIMFKSAVSEPTNPARLYCNASTVRSRIAVTETTGGGATTTVGNGTDPASATLAPGAVATDLDAFTLQTSSGTDTVTSTTVTLAAGTAGGLALVEIVNDAGTVVYGSAANPATDSPAVTTSGLTATTALLQYRVRITPKSHANMPVPPGATYTLTGRVTAITSTNTKTYSDSSSATLTIDNLSPANAAAFSGTAGDAQVALSWTNPGDADFSQVLVLRKAASAITDAPTEGATYSVPGTLAASTIIYVGSLSAFTDTALTNGTPYYYRIYAKDSNGNYASGGTAAGPYTPARVTSVGNGTDPANASLAPGGAATPLDAFTLQTTGGTDTVTAVTVSFAAGTAAGLALVEVTDDAGTVVYGSAADPATDTAAIATSGLTATTALLQYRVRITPTSHANMPVPPGATYTATGTVTAITSTNAKTYGDSSSATLTIDNLSPGNPSAFSGQAGNTQVALSWTNPAAADFSAVIVLRQAAVAVAEAPVEGTAYAAPGTLGASTIVYVGSLTSFADSGLTNETAYYYRIYAKDGNGNYSATGVSAGPYTPTLTTTVGNGTDPANVSLAPGGPLSALDAFTLTTASGTDTVTSLTVTLAAGTAAGLGLIEIVSNDTFTVYGSVANPAADTVTFALSPSMPVTTTTAAYKVWVTPRTHAAMPAPPGADYAVTGTVTAIVCTNAKTYSDTTSATVTIDNAAPADPVWGTVAAGDSQVTLNWTNPAAADFAEVLVLRDAATVADRPAEGATYTAGGLIGTSAIRYVGSLQTYVDTGLTNDTSYHYAIFARDTSGNWSVGAASGPHVPALSGRLDVTNPAQPAAASLPAGTAGTTVGRLTLSASLGDVTVTELRFTNTGTALAESDIQGVQVFNQASGAFLGTAAWDGSQYRCSAFPFTIANGTAVTAVLQINVAFGATAGNTFAMRFASGDVAVQAPAVVNTVALCTGNTFTITAGASEGDVTPNSTAPTVLIVNPANGATVSLSQTGEIRAQVHVYNPGGLTGLTAALSLNGGSSYTVALTPNTNYAVGTNAGIYEARLALTAGAYSLRARATNAAAQAVVSGPVLITANPYGKGDGNLLVRDNSDQLCLDCHAIATHSSQSSGKYGSWAVGCRACHTPHNTTNIYLLRKTITPPAVNGYSPAQTVQFSTTTGDSNAATAAQASFVNSDGSGPCQVCHTRTVKPGTTTKRWQRGAGTAGNTDTHYTSAAGTRPCVDCHNHKNGFVASESSGGATCGGCHAAILTGMSGAKASKHTLGGVLGTNDDFLDSGVAWSNPLANTAANNRSCVNMCHQDHVHNQPPAGTTHDYNVHQDAATSGARVVTRNGSGTITAGTPTRLDFDNAAANGGLCVSCHANPVDASRPAVDKAAYAAGAHNYVTFSTYGTWNYTLHDGSTFDRNCSKCHWSDTTQQASGLTVGAVHYSDFPALLSGTINPNGVPATYTCNLCHGSGTIGANRSGKDTATDMAKTGGRHPVNSDSKHNLAAELAPATTYNNGVFSGVNRHVNCLDCHSPHAARSGVHTYSTTATSTRNLATNPLAKVSGVQFNYAGLANFAAPAAANYTWIAASTGATYEYQVCFKCHTSFTFGTTPPAGLSANGTQATPPETDLAQEFNPANKSGHPVVVGLSSYTGNTAPKALGTAVMRAPWNTNVGTQTMLCSDCHNTDAASPAAQGPHGSAVQFMLRNFGAGAPAPTAWPNVTTTNRATAWCANCHTLSNSVHTRGDHGSTPCYGCHIVVPHGGKMSRLIGDNNSTMPTRYAYNNSLANLRIQSFTKPTSGSYVESNCQSGTSGCTNHSSAGTENW